MKNLFCLLFLIVCSLSYAQDQLFKKDNSKIDVKILEINETEVKYKLFTYQDGPTIIISKNEIAMIIYQNGSHEVFNNPVTTTQTIVITQPKPIDFKVIEPQKQDNTPKIEDLLKTKNLISCNLMEPLNGTFGFSYLREFGNNYFNVYVPISVGFSSPFMNQITETSFNAHRYNQDNITKFTYDRKVGEIGLGIHFQSSGKNKVTHFVGPYVGVAQYNGTFMDDSNYLNDYYGYYVGPSYQTHGFVMNRYYIMLNNGFLFRVTQNFNITLLAAFGYQQDTFVANNPEGFKKYNGYNNYSPPAPTFPINAFKFNFSMGYRF
jgi:hypothetical protein